MSREGCQKLVRGQGGGAEFANDDAAGVVGDFGGVLQLETGGESQSQQRDGGVTRAGNVIDLASTRMDVVRALAALKEHHAVLAKGDEDAIHGPFFEKDAADFEQLGIFVRWSGQKMIFLPFLSAVSQASASGAI